MIDHKIRHFIRVQLCESDGVNVYVKETMEHDFGERKQATTFDFLNKCNTCRNAKDLGKCPLMAIRNGICNNYIDK